MIESPEYGFIVIDEERINFDSIFDEGEKGTIFVEFDITKRLHWQPKIKANLYYHKGFAKWNLVTIEELKARFPKSFKMGNPSEEYNLLKGF